MTLIADNKDKLESDKVVLHWFQRDEEGKTMKSPAKFLTKMGLTVIGQKTLWM